MLVVLWDVTSCDALDTPEPSPAEIELRTVVRIGRRADEGIVELAAEEDADLILFGWGGPDRARRSVAEQEDFQPVFSPTIGEVIRDPTTTAVCVPRIMVLGVICGGR